MDNDEEDADDVESRFCLVEFKASDDQSINRQFRS
jgi:hypothetical protein